ncbi:beta-2 adrenergic receptor-like [Orbicella faveolata]|uniref:beta-2 adrenergic receptor-like n=1 Tax=Orbicella faveolata TaxID=48498 RepID=UPI0009E1FFB7|nr:beta-2 adrenergic receptor-like [Orbicella faveolata]
MNHTTSNTTLLSCGFTFFPLNPAKISPDLHAVFIFIIAVNALTCPFIILLNILVIVTVKAKRHLRSKSNIALACLATTDLVVGLVVQPLLIASASLLVKGEANMFCTAFKVSQRVTQKCCVASFHHLLLINAERYIAIKHSMQYDNLITEIRIIIASSLVWVTTIFLPLEDMLTTEKRSVAKLTVLLTVPLVILVAMIYFNGAVYQEVRRNEKRIAANQVSLEAKAKLLKNNKAFYLTIIVLLAVFLCYIPANICFAIFRSAKDSIPAKIGHVVVHLLSLMPILNSFINPLIYVVRIRYFRVAFIQLLSRKTIAQAEDLERKVFGPRQIGVMATAEQRQESASRQEDQQRENGTFNNEPDSTVRTQRREENEERAL